MTLLHPDGTSFSTGSCPYRSRPATPRDETERIFLPISVESVQTEAVLDTGGSFLICDPEWVELLEIDPDHALGRQAIVVRGVKYEGTLHRLEVTIVPELGESYPFQATTFVPGPDSSWPLPTYMGWFGCLERIRFAIDPGTQTFYFGRTDAT